MSQKVATARGRSVGAARASAEVDELQVEVEVGALEERDRGLQVVAALGLHAELVALDLALDALRRLVADQLVELLGVVAVDPVLQLRLDPVLLAARERLAGVEALQGYSAFDEFR